MIKAGDWRVDMREFWARCTHPKGTDSDFMCICPAHADKTGSLHVTQGDDRLLLHCFAGCDTDAILAAMGLERKDLFFRPMERGEAAAPRKEKEKYPIKRHFKVGETWYNFRKKREETITAVYEYQNLQGNVDVKVARTEIIIGDHKEKSFPVHYLDEDGKWYNGKGKRTDLLYRLPEMLAAKAEGKTIYIVEGEKDVDNARRLGLDAVCNIGGGGKDNVAGKWTFGCTAHLKGAGRVVLIPDNDAAGEGLMRYVASELHDKVEDLRIIRLKDAMPELSEHGDLTDFARNVGGIAQTLEKINGLIDSAKPLTAEDVITMNGTLAAPASDAPPSNPRRQTDGEDGDEGEDYYGLKEYCVKYGCLCKRTQHGARRLCSFVPHAREAIVRDDGERQTTDYIIGATAFNGRELPDTIVHGEDELLAMRWPMRAWQFYGNVYPVNGAEKMIKSAILSAAARRAPVRHVYGYTGWRKFGDEWAYLYNGGAVGNDHVSVELPGVMGTYSLAPVYTGEETPSAQDGIFADIALLGQFPAHIIFPLLAQAFLAPLYTALEEIHEPPSYIVYVVGAPQSFKSTLVGYVLSHFGDFYERRMPATFQDTSNSVREKPYIVKDALFVVDDYVAQARNSRLRAQMDSVADGIISAIADHAVRGRLDKNQEIRDARPPRCTCIMTGEQMPGVSPSRRGRLYVVDIKKGEIARRPAELTPHKNAATRGHFRAAMRGYIDYLRPRIGTMHGELRTRIARISKEADARAGRSEGRWLQAVTHLMLGIEMMCAYFEHEGAIDATVREGLIAAAWTATLDNVQRQGAETDENSAIQIYINTLRGMIAAGTVSIANLDDPNGLAGIAINRIGYMDSEYYYLLPEPTDAAVRDLLRKQDVDMGLTPVQMRKQMRDDGLCKPSKSGAPLLNKTIGGKTTRVLCLPRVVLDGGDMMRVGDTAMEIIEEQDEMPF